MKHAVLGAGAVGGFLGTALASLGEDVTVLVRREKLPGYPTNLSVDRPGSALNATVKVAATLASSVEVLWIATKTYQLETALHSIQSSPHCIIPLLNGVDHVEALRTHFGRDRVLPGTIAIEAERIAPGRFVQRSPFVKLNLVASAEQVLGATVARLRDLGFTCSFIQSEPTLLWSKLCFLGPFALVTSASGMNKGQIYADAEWKSKLIAAMAEACAVAKACGAEVDASQIQTIYDGLPLSMRSSMQKDLDSQRQLELDAIGGPIVRGGRRYGMEVSATASLIAAISAKVSGRAER